ncbi:CAMK protein kinase, variant [Microbotryum lychnidis-dioicae p1A1 Lamole]|uniref:CAMK protein kinase n=1 Tax=Microbotryum lychnidis-dioicae (strain p1A1 Lamole / MvSl-1064) TaxID=683840 RepID=U5H7Z0_USTV1|nr:CAMK protein kinase [Microbotryum lychnidis-dioicae p1A1 Lamole]KDE06321.1 CAMK protein kinase, variant [Microbotryum lychnidis-dioicae p1A1 Lamole]|eukprot:KDE06320.1 CAMK protein kinase [Microbotryum lychnidis-dioicae p1A1 Lamole]
MSTAVYTSPNRASGTIIPRLAHDFANQHYSSPTAGKAVSGLRTLVTETGYHREDVGKNVSSEGTNGRSKTDIFSITDATLAEKLQFVTEVGFGNWGSVWKCVRKTGSSKGETVAVKLVHRSKNPTSSARVRSLWTEFKAIRSLRGASHPNLIHFESFIITPSYALCVMPYYPRLMPVALPESRARFYFRGLLSAVEFLHAHGCSHNDIKPANILLGSNDTPVLCDFGFAVQYARDAPERFLSSLSWGTPEYLSPERAKGILHDERLSDVWALGVTMWEIVVGRTPFERTESEEFLTRDALEVYYGRTVEGSFCGEFKVSSDFEDLIHHMVEPNVKQRVQGCGLALLHRFFEMVPTPQHSPKTIRYSQGTPKSAQTPVKNKTPVKVHGSSSRKGTPSRKVEKRDSIQVHRDRTSSPFQEKADVRSSFPLRPLLLGERRANASPTTSPLTQPSTPRQRVNSGPKAKKVTQSPSTARTQITTSRITSPSKIPVRAPLFVALPRIPNGPARIPSKHNAPLSHRTSKVALASPQTSSSPEKPRRSGSQSPQSTGGAHKRQSSQPPAMPTLFRDLTTPIEQHGILPPAPKDHSEAESKSQQNQISSQSRGSSFESPVLAFAERQKVVESRAPNVKSKRSVSFQAFTRSSVRPIAEDRSSPKAAADPSPQQTQPSPKRESNSMVKRLRAMSVRRTPSVFSFRGFKPSANNLAAPEQGRRTSAAGSMLSVGDTTEYGGEPGDTTEFGVGPNRTIDSTAHSSLRSEISRLESFSRHIQTIIDAGRANEAVSSTLVRRSISPSSNGSDAVEQLGAAMPILSREELAEFRAREAQRSSESLARQDRSSSRLVGVAPRRVSRSAAGASSSSADAKRQPSVKIRPSLAPSFVQNQTTQTESEEPLGSSASSQFSEDSSTASIKAPSEEEDTMRFKRGHRRIPTAIRNVPSISLTESEDESTEEPDSPNAPNMGTLRSVIVEEGRQLPTWVPEPIEKEDDGDSDDADVDEPTITLVPSPVRGGTRLLRMASRTSTLRKSVKGGEEPVFETCRSAPAANRPRILSSNAARTLPRTNSPNVFSNLIAVQPLQRSVKFRDSPSPPPTPTSGDRTDSRASSHARPQSRGPSRSRSVLSFFSSWSSSLSRASTPSFSVDSLATSSDASNVYQSEEELAYERMKKSANAPKGAKHSTKWRNALKKLF